MAAKAAIRKQWKAFLQSENGIVGASILASAAAAAAIGVANSQQQQQTSQQSLDDDEDSTAEHSISISGVVNDSNAGVVIPAPLHTNTTPTQHLLLPRQRFVQCETLLPYQRVSSGTGRRRVGVGGSRSCDNGINNPGFEPWQSFVPSSSSASNTSFSSRKSLLLHRRSTKYGDGYGGRKKEEEMDMHDKYDVDFNTVLGEGSYGRVHPATLLATGETVALKKISKRYTDSTAIHSETDALLRIYENGGHPNISGLRDMYEDYSHYYLFLDLAKGGEMFNQLIQHGQYSEFDASRLVTEILSALAFLHNIGVVHADLKPENILLCSGKRGSETVKIIDFGCASVEQRGESSLFSETLSSGNSSSSSSSSSLSSSSSRIAATTKPKKKVVSSIGTRAYWSPERFQTNSVTEEGDLYALGIILFIMLVGVHPFDIKGIASDEEIEEQIQKCASPPMHLATHLSPSARDFIKSLMERDPSMRLTAITGLRHPWIRGVTPTSNSIEGSDTKLSMYQDLREKLASGIFAALVDGEKLRDNKSDTNEESTLTHLLKRAFEVFDEEGKGYVTEADLGRVMTKVTGAQQTPSDSKDMLKAAKKESPTTKSSSLGLSLSDFSQLFSRLSHQHYKRGDFIYHPGDNGDAMYFINSGKVEILTKKGHLVSILRHGDFFGEGSLLEDRNHRITAARCSTPVDVIAVSKNDFGRYLSSSSTKRSLKLKWKARNLAQAKQLIRIQTNHTQRQLENGDVVYQEGDIGKSMFLVNDGTLEVKHGEKTLHQLSSGDSFGESSLLFQRPRSSTVMCASEKCSLHEMRGADFFALLESDPAHARALRDMGRKRMFQKAVKSYLLLSHHSDLSDGELTKVFHDADKDKSGTLSLSEMRDLMLHMGQNSAIPERDLRELLKSLDLDEDGQVTLKDILEVSKSFK